MILAASVTEKEKTAPVEVTIVAPSSVKKLVEKYITLPDKPFENEIRQAIYARNIKQETTALLATEGYFTPEVEFGKQPRDAKSYELRITPGPRARVAAVSIEFRGDLAADTPEHRVRVEQLRAEWPLKSGKIFRSARWEDAKSVLLSSVTKRDYAAARTIESRAEIDPDTAQATLTVIIDSEKPRLAQLVQKG